jgi:hypothetical protein
VPPRRIQTVRGDFYSAERKLLDNRPAVSRFCPAVSKPFADTVLVCYEWPRRLQQRVPYAGDDGRDVSHGSRASRIVNQIERRWREDIAATLSTQ